nr:RuvB-like protein 2 [Cryptomonas curvata]
MIKRKNKFYKTIENQIIFSNTQHSHIRGIGLYNIFNFKYALQGFIGQICARKAAAIFLYAVKNSEIQRINVIIVGNSGTGKTCLSIAIGLSIDKTMPFVAVNGAELNFLSVSKIENIKQIIRKAIGVKFFNESFIIQGEVVDVKINEESEKNNISFAKLILKTNEIQSTYKIGWEIYSSFLKKKIKKGDIITIDKEKNLVEKTKHFEKKNFQYKENNIGNLEKHEIHEHIITMYELDLLNSFSDFAISKLFIDDIQEISNEIREKIDRIVIKWQKNNKIKIIRGVLLLDEANLLNIDSFAYLSKNIESFISPSIILSTGNSDLKIHDVNYISSHGIPTDFLDRFLIIQTNPYSYNEIKKILFIKANEETLLIDAEAYELLTKIGIECGIRYSIYILSIIILVSDNKSKTINTIEIKKSFLMFIDTKRFIRYSKKLKKKNIFCPNQKF